MSVWIRLSSLLVLGLLAVTGLQAQSGSYTKNVLIEDFTGAWCVHCPDGARIVMDIKRQHGERVIPVFIHNGDAMAIPVGRELEQMMGLGGFPSAAIDRSTNPMARSNRGTWGAEANARLRLNPAVGISIEQRYNAATRELRVTAYAEFLQALAGDLRFNVYLVEDSLSGSGQGWDQTAPGGPIPGYVHRHVLRHALGGAQGLAGRIPGRVAAGDLASAEFPSFTIPASWNPNRVHVVAFVHRAGGEVYNAAAQPLGAEPPCAEGSKGLVSGRLSYRASDNLCAGCRVEALSFGPESREFDVLATAIADDEGNYSLEIPVDRVPVYLRATDREGGDYLPSYGGRQLVAGFARPLGRLSCLTATTGINIELQRSRLREGTGALAGIIRDGAGKTGELPLSNLSVVLARDNSAVAHTRTDDQGRFGFRNIEPGTYSVWVDAPFIVNSEAPVIEVEANNEATAELLFVLRRDRLERVFPTSRPDLTETLGWTVAPNPFRHSTRLSWTHTGHEPLSVRVFDLSGRLVEELALPQGGAGSRQIEWSAPAAGLYLLELRSGSHVSWQRLVAQP